MPKNDAIDPELVRELANLVTETGLSEIEVEKGDLRIRVARRLEPVSVQVAAPAPLAERPHPHSAATFAAAFLAAWAIMPSRTQAPSSQASPRASIRSTEAGPLPFSTWKNSSQSGGVKS